MRGLLNYIVLPREVTDFEDGYLKRVNTIALWFFAIHIPVFTAIAYFNKTGPFLALALTGAVFLGPLLAIRGLKSRRSTSVVMAIASQLMGGLLVHFGQGPIQIEMHFYFFVLIALLAMFANPMVVIAGAVTTALHHAILWPLLPSSVFNYDAPFWVVAVHALFVVLESVAACYIARSFFNNVIGLEKKVQQRTEALAGRNRDMRMLLGAVDQGFFTLDSDGRMSEERSAKVDQWLDTPEAGIQFVECLSQWDDKAAGWIEMGLEEVFDGMLPPEVAADQLPKSCTIGERSLAIEYKPIENENGVESVAVILSDITEQLERERVEAEHREMMAIFERVAADRPGVLEFFAESEEIMVRLADWAHMDITLAKRMVHTLKGNTSMFGLQSVAEHCHEMEDLIDSENRMPEAEAWEELATRWDAVRTYIRKIAGDRDDANELHFGEEDYAALFRDIIDGAPKDDVIRRLASWKLEPTERRLTRVAEQAQNLAVRLGKPEIDVKIDDGALRMESTKWVPFWSAFVHVIRNAVDHGLETPEERAQAGKESKGLLEIRTRINSDMFVISARDDGRGINWDTVRAKAESRGLSISSHDDLVEALFADGLSTAESVSSTSGRGVGLAAIREATEAMGGEAFIESTLGKGTVIEFRFPIDSVAKDTVAMLTERGVEAPRLVISPASKKAA
ncbi:MAG: hypothetical protein Phyf2KO_11660 [Phycisphaerales bacterium]